jgi:hypothetical protein
MQLDQDQSLIALDRDLSKESLRYFVEIAFNQV